MIGQTIAHYRILEKLGSGGMGEVYRAEDIRLGRPVAIKMLPPDMARDEKRRRRFQEEARAAAALSHPGIATVFSLEEFQDQLWLVYEYVPGRNLRQLLEEGFPSQQLLSILSGIAEGLCEAHEKGIVHRDLKPENIMLTSQGGVKILDFGLARFTHLQAGTHTRLTDAGSLVGTVGYMSPEQLEGEEVDFRSDLFSFGIVAYELATGRHPFQGATPASTIRHILADEPPPLVGPRNLPPELERILQKCLRKAPEQRYQSTRDLVLDLKELSLYRKLRSSAAPEQQESFLRRALFRAVGGPRQWWELNHLFSVLVYPLLTYLAWRLLAAPEQWWTGESLLLGLIVLASVTVTLRLYLLLTWAIHPDGLPREVERVGKGILWVSLAYWLLLFLLSLLLVLRGSKWALVLMGLGMGGTVAVGVAEPAIDRSAFAPQDRLKGSG